MTEKFWNTVKFTVGGDLEFHGRRIRWGQYNVSTENYLCTERGFKLFLVRRGQKTSRVVLFPEYFMSLDWGVGMADNSELPYSKTERKKVHESVQLKWVNAGASDREVKTLEELFEWASAGLESIENMDYTGWKAFERLTDIKEQVTKVFNKWGLDKSCFNNTLKDLSLDKLVIA